MKKSITLLTLSTLFAFSAMADIKIEEGQTIYTSEYSGESISFKKNATLIVDESATIGMPNPAVYGANLTVDIKKDQTLTATGRMIAGGGSMEIIGEGLYNSNASSVCASTFIVRTKAVANAGISLGATDGGTLTPGAKMVIASDFESKKSVYLYKGTASQPTTLTIGEVDSNGNVLSTGSLNLTSTNYSTANDYWILARDEGASITINKGSEIKVGVVQLIKEIYTSATDGGADITVNGTLTVNSNPHSGYKSFSIWANNIKVGSTGVVTSMADPTTSDGDRGMFVKRSLDNAGSISIASNLYMSNNSVLTLREGSNIKTGGATSQADALIYLQDTNKTYTAGGKTYNGVSSGTKNVANVNLVLEGDQVLGGFRAVAGSTLTIDLKGNKLDLGSFEDLDGGLNFSIIINDFANGLISFASDSKIATDTADINKIVKAYADIDGVKTLLDLEWKTDGDRSYLFSGSLVPEPAEWAAIFGAIALAFVAYRRRK